MNIGVNIDRSCICAFALKAIHIPRELWISAINDTKTIHHGNQWNMVNFLSYWLFFPKYFLFTQVGKRKSHLCDIWIKQSDLIHICLKSEYVTIKCICGRRHQYTHMKHIKAHQTHTHTPNRGRQSQCDPYRDFPHGKVQCIHRQTHCYPVGYSRAEDCLIFSVCEEKTNNVDKLVTAW